MFKNVIPYRLAKFLMSTLGGLPMPEGFYFSGKFSIESPGESDKKTRLSGYDDLGEVEALIDNIDKGMEIYKP